MLCRDSFKWVEDLVQAFEQLKIIITCTLVLALPNFTILFILECDASDTRMGAVLQQEV